MAVIIGGVIDRAGLDQADARESYMGGRLVRSTTALLSLTPYFGFVVEVNGEIIQIQELTENPLLLNVASNVIDGAGADTAAAMAASTFYYVYVSNSQASYAPSSLRGSTVAPTADEDTNGILYLAPEGNARNWRFIGCVFTDSGTLFQDDVARRHVANFYNRIARRLYVNPGYTDDNSFTTLTLNSAVWTPLNAGTGDGFSWAHIGNLASNSRIGHQFEIHAQYMASTVAANTYVGIGLDSTTQPSVACAIAANTCASTSVALTAATGRRQAHMLAVTTSGNTLFFTDFQRLGAAADPPVTLMSAVVWV